MLDTSEMCSNLYMPHEYNCRKEIIYNARNTIIETLLCLLQQNNVTLYQRLHNNLIQFNLFGDNIQIHTINKLST